jgi:hypothetical protein
MAHERAIMLATAQGEANEVAQRVSILERKLMATRRARGTAEEKLPNLTTKVAATDQQRVGAEE